MPPHRFRGYPNRDHNLENRLSLGLRRLETIYCLGFRVFKRVHISFIMLSIVRGHERPITFVLSVKQQLQVTEEITMWTLDPDAGNPRLFVREQSAYCI